MKFEAIVKSYIITVMSGSLAFCAGSSAYAQDAAPTAVVTPAATTGETKNDGLRDFAGIKFGIGVSATFDLGSNDRISTAEVVNGLVRVTDKDNVRARIMLESHYFFEPERKFFTGTPKEDWGYGPFIALQPGTDEIIEAIGFGMMVGFKRNKDTNQSFNIGLGVAYDPNTQTLGDDIIDGQPLPEGETNVRFLEQDQVGFLVLTSFSF